MSAQAPSPAASGTVSSPSVNASSPSSNGSVPGSNSSPPPQQIQPSTPPSTSSPPPASSPPPPSTNPTTPPPGSPPPVSSPPPSSSKATPPSPSPPAQSPPPAANAQPPAGSPPPPANAPPPAQSPPSPVNAPPPAKSSPPPVNAPPPAQSPPPPANVSPPAQSPPQNLSPPPKSSPTSPPPSIKPSTPPPAESPSKSTTTPPSIVSPPSSSPSPPSSLSSPPTSSPTQNSPSPKESPPSPETPTPAGIPSPPSLTPPGTGSSSSPTPNSTLAGGTSSSSSSGNVPIAAIAGIAVGALVVLAVFGVLFRYIRKKQRRDNYPGNYYAPAPPGSISRKSDGVYASNSPNSDQYFAQASPSTVIPGYGYDKGHQGSKYSSGDAIGVPAQVATSGLGNSKSWFTYEELAIATNGFSPQNVLGEGGFGCVYKGYLEGGKVVAVKQLKIGGGQGEREFRAEVDIISRVHHRHLVSLVGYCIADSQRLLVYEYVPNGTLEYHLHGRGRPVMDWPTRLRIAVGAARGIAYLHEDCHPRIIHRDIKSANILLDDRFEAQVSDFGLAKLALDAHTHVTTRVMGTFGYMAPEYASSGKLTQRSDVFSFGVVLLEFVTGRKPVDTSQPLGDESLVEWARPLLSHALEEGNFEALVDPRLENNFNQGEMFRMIEAAAACVRHSAQRRPRMGQVVRALESDAAMADLNNGVKPGQSTMYNSAQYSADIRRFRRMAFGSQDVGSDFSGVSSEYDMNPSTSSSEYHKSKEVEAKLSRHLKTDLESASGSEYQSSESETRPINISRSHKDETGERSSGELPTNFQGQSLKGR